MVCPGAGGPCGRAGVRRTAGQAARKNAAVCGCDRAAAVQLHCAGAAQPLPGMPGLPLLLARRLGAVLGVPVETPLYIKRRGRPQKELTREQRLQNARGAFGCRPGTDLTGRRVLLIDDIITTGATASACALALLEAGAVEVTAVAIAAAEELPKSRKKPPETKP